MDVSKCFFFFFFFLLFEEGIHYCIIYIYWKKIKTLHFMTRDCVAFVTYAPISFMITNWTDVQVITDKLHRKVLHWSRCYSSFSEICKI